MCQYVTASDMVSGMDGRKQLCNSFGIKFNEYDKKL